MHCYRRILHISWTQKITNSDIRKHRDINEDLVQKVMKRKMDLFGHIARMNNSRKIKSVLMGVMDGSNGRGRPCREWLDDIKEWCQKDIQLLSVMAQERNKWKEVVRCALDTYGLSAHGS